MIHDLHFLHGSRAPHCTAVVDKRLDGYFGLQFMAEGRVSLGYDAEEHALAGPCVWTAWPGPWTRFRAAPGSTRWDHRYVAFRGELAERWFAAGILPRKPIALREPFAVTQLFDALHEMIFLPDPLDRLRAINLLERILIHVNEQSPARSDRSLVDGIRTFLERTPLDQIDYAELAAQHAMAASTLRRRFREATGIPIHAYAMQQKVAQAKQLLTTTDLAIKSIAEQLGYRDVYYFTRQFTRTTGMPPSRFRKSL